MIPARLVGTLRRLMHWYYVCRRVCEPLTENFNAGVETGEYRALFP
jgi:hypothetical protein